MSKAVLTTPSAPGALGPYSVAVQANDLVFLSGQIAIDPESGERAPDDVAVQTQQIMDNIGAILGDVGLTHDDIVKTTIFLVDIGDFPVVNDVYARSFAKAPPARSTVGVAALPGGFLVEIEVVASR